MMVVASSSASRMYAVAQLQERSHCQRVRARASSGDGAALIPHDQSHKEDADFLYCTTNDS